MQAIDLFSGAGGMSAGAIDAGIQVRYAVEADPNACATYALNHLGTELIRRDIRAVKGSELKLSKRRSQLTIFGGPPCQGFSTSNQKNRSAENNENWLFREYLRLVKDLRPDWIVLENVKGLLETESGYFLDAILKGFRAAGYATSHFVLNSADFGVPQKRNRLFIIGSLHGIELNTPQRSAARYVTVAQAFGDLPDIENGNLADVKEYARPATSLYAKSLRGVLKECANNLVTKSAPKILERYKHIPPGGNWEDIPKRLMKNYADVSRCHTGIYKRLRSDQPSIVIGNFRKNMLIHPWKDRGLSVREAARLQSFPDSYRFLGSIGFQQQQVGDAVPPLLAKAVFKQILANSQ